jgi:regulator of RNase E activity RraA
MSDAYLKPETKAQLEHVSVATLATALFKRGLCNQVIQDVRPVKPKAHNMVGPAFTLRYIPAREDCNQLAGVVTDGGFRDAMNIGELDIPAYHNRPSSPTNLTNNEAIEINGPIGCGNVAVFPGDIMVGDADSVIVIPAEIADEVAAEATEMTAYEDFAIEQVRAGQSIIGLYPATHPENLDAFQEWRKQNNR